MRGAVCSVAILCLGCAQIYAPTPKNPALVRVPASAGFGIGDQIHLVAIDDTSVDASPNVGNQWQIDPGVRRLTVTYEASKKIVGPRVASSPLILTAKLAPGANYQVVCESSSAGVKASCVDNRTVESFPTLPNRL